MNDAPGAPRERRFSIYEMRPPELHAALRVLQAVVGPSEHGHARLLNDLARRTGRRVVDVSGGRVTLGWLPEADGVWLGDGIDGIRSARPAPPRLLRTFAACVRCCWRDPATPLYPSAVAKIQDVLAVVVALGATSDEEEPRRATEMHAKGALTTLEAAGLIEIDRAAGALTMGPAVATWTDQEVAVLRQTWSRLPEPPASDPSSSHARRPPVSAVSLTYQNTSSSTKDPATRSMERGLSLTALDQKGREHVLVAVRAIEEAEQPVPKNAFRALSDEALRASVERILAESGRVLLETREGFLSGYSDAVAHALTTTGLGVLPPDDRAVLALVLLHAVAIPRARGIIPPNSDWTVSESVPPRILTNSKLPEATIKNSLRRLRDAKILGYGRNHGVVPGPQFNRLTPQATESIFEELVLLSEPHGLLAESIRLRRQARAT